MPLPIWPFGPHLKRVSGLLDWAVDRVHHDRPEIGDGRRRGKFTQPWIFLVQKTPCLVGMVSVTIPYHTILYYTILYCTVLYYTTLTFWKLRKALLFKAWTSLEPLEFAGFATTCFRKILQELIGSTLSYYFLHAFYRFQVVQDFFQ